MQTTPTVRAVDLSGNPLSRFPVALLVLSPHNILEAMDSIDISGSAVRNIPTTYHTNIVPLLKRTRKDAASLDHVHVVLVGYGGQGKSTALLHVFFPHANTVLPKGVVHSLDACSWPSMCVC